MSLGTLFVDLQANTGEFVSQLSKAASTTREAARQISSDFTGVARSAQNAFSSTAANQLSQQMSTIRRMSAELAASVATGNTNREQEVAQRRNIIQLAEQEINLARQKGSSEQQNLNYLRAATAEINKQKSAIAGGGPLTSIVDAIKLRIAGLPGLGSWGSMVMLRAYEPVGKQLESEAGALEEKFDGAAVAVGGITAAVVALGAVALESTHHLVAMAQTIENTSAATGLSNRQVQEYTELAKEMDVNSGDLEMSFARIESQLGEFITTGKAAGNGSQYFVRVMREMGVSLTDAQGKLRSTNDIVGDFADALSKIPDAGERSALEMAALGTRGRVLAQVMEEATREGISLRDALKSIDESGNVIPDSELSQLMEAKERWDELARAIRGVRTELEGLIAEGVLHPSKGLFAMAQIGTGDILGAIATLKNAEAEGAKAGGGAGGTGGADVLRLGQAIQLNEQLEQRVAILRAGGETQLQLKEAEASYAAAVKSNNTELAKAYQTQIADLKAILALEADRKKHKGKSMEAQEAEDNERAARKFDEIIKGMERAKKESLAKQQRANAEELRQENEDNQRAARQFSEIIKGMQRAKEEALKKQQEQDEKVAAYSVTGSYGSFQSKQLQNLKQIREALQAAGQSTLLVDAAIAKAGDESVRKWDQAAQSIGTMSERWRAFANEVSTSADNTAGRFFDVFKKGIDDLSSTLAKAAVTGKANFADMFASIAEGLIKAEIQWSISKLFKPYAGAPGSPNAPGGTPGVFSGPLGLASSIAGVFGIKGGGAARPGPSGGPGDPFYVTFSSGLPGLGGSSLSSNPLSFLFPGASSSSSGAGDGSSSNPFYSIIADSGGTPFDDSNPLTTVLSPASLARGAGSALSSGLGGLTSILSFLPGFAGGGRPTPGAPAIVGENGPELFVPDRSGTVMPSVRGSAANAGAGGYTHVEMTVVTPDADSFRRSQDQIHSEMMQRMSQAHYRNRG